MKPMMKRTLIASALLASFALVPSAQAGTWYVELIGGGTVSFLGVGGRHTWSDAWGPNTCSGDMTESWHSGVASCSRYGGSWNQSSCSYAYNAWNIDESFESDTVNSCTDVYNRFARYFNVFIPGAYLVNGVCHQASNRALYGTRIPWIRNLAISGGVTSYLAFGDCGSWYPYGLGLPNCQYHV